MVNGEKLKTEQPVKMTVRIYDDEFSGELLFEENQDVATGSEKAVFSFEQGNITVRQRTSGLNTAALWVEVESDGQVMTPRLNLAEIDTVNDLTGESIQLRSASLRTGGTATLLIDENGVTLGNLLNMGSQSIILDGVSRNTWPDGSSSTETDPTVLASVKDGVSWAEVTGKPSVIGDITRITAGTGLNGGGSTGDVTLNIDVPLDLAGSISATSASTGISGTSSGNIGRGVYGKTTGTSGRGVYGEATGVYGKGVFGEATGTGNVQNFGGYFRAAGDTGRGVYGDATGASGWGVYGGAKGDTGHGVTGIASGHTGWGVYGYASNIGAYKNYGGYFEANGETGRGVYGEATNTGAVRNYGGYFVANGNTGRGVYGYAAGDSGRGVKGFADGADGVGVEGVSDHGIGVRGVGATYDFYANGTGTNYGSFTGGHDVCLKTGLESEIKPGMIVSVSGQIEKRVTESGEISLSATLPTVMLADQAQDKAIFGVLVSESSFPDDHWYKAQEDEHLGIVNALGEGRMWVSNINGDIEVGDYITSSVLPGYGQLQNDDFIHSYTVGKAIETVDWETVTECITDNGEQIKVYLIAIVYTSG